MPIPNPRWRLPADRLAAAVALELTLTLTITLVLALSSSASVEAQTLRDARSLWASDASDVPTLAIEVDRMLAAGTLSYSRQQRDGQFQGRTHERMNQYHGGVRVIGGQLVWQRDSGRILSITGNLYDGIDVDTTPTLTSEEAAARAPEGTRVVGPVELVVLPLRERFVLAYRFHARGERTLDHVFVDARSGTVVLSYNDLRSQSRVGRGIGTWTDEKKMSVEAAAGTNRAVDDLRPFGIRTYDVRFNFDAWNFYQAEADRFLAVDGDNEWTDGAVVDAHAYAGYTYDYYFKRHGRRGIDDQGRSAINFVHILPRDAGVNNAFYDPFDNSLNYFDGDGETFNFFSSSLEVVAHELTHGVDRFGADLIYLNESGALSEAFSDIMGTAVEFFYEPPGRGRQRAEWWLGEDLFFDFGFVFRSLENPASIGDPDHYDVRCTPADCPPDFDNGGVHINSSIANHAFYLMVVGGRNRVSGINVEGLGIENMDRIESIFYRAFLFYLVSSSNYQQAREATIRAARELYGAGSVEEQTVVRGWDAVGVR